MTFPSTFDAYVPSNGPDFFALSNIKPDYVPFTTLQAVAVHPAADSFAYAKRLSPPAVFGHVVRCFYFALALLYTGFPSGTPGIAQIGFAELSLRIYHTALLHDLGWSNNTEVLTHPAHAMTFELHGAIMAYEHLHAAAPSLDAVQVGDIVESIVLHTSQWPSGNSSANQILMSLSALFDVGGYNGTGLVGLNSSSLWHPQTVQEIERAYPRADFYNEGLSIFDREFVQKPNCLLSHYPGGLDALVKDLRVGPIVEVNSTSAHHGRALKDPHLD
ncbi:hypothetical protein GGX14DRAFT_654240 [Mycena pura]|uniref:HD domain-containing protein n=1 Tax=Mycena pura TaxID=153505 RepID=A0AAD6YAH3_9AGAR|nr:hypothetical protein GGX14DRAFT_654240 [Mycena pura]